MPFSPRLAIPPPVITKPSRRIRPKGSGRYRLTAIQKLFPKYAHDQHGQPVKSPYDALPALTLQDAKDSALDLSQLDDLDVVQNGTGAMRAYEHIRYGLAASDQAARKFMRRQLMRYCELDTAAMVMIWKHWLG